MRIPHFALKTVTLLTFAALSTLAAAQDTDAVPGRVGRVALTQGQVSIGNDVGAEMTPAQVNWPVTSGTMISTARGARTELRIGSTSLRLDGDSSLEVTELDDANLRLRLHYGSASVRVLDPQVVPGFELDTPQARVRLQQGARLRVDAERVRDMSMVEVFDGAALVDGGGSELTLRAGKRAELGDDDVRTLAVRPDDFDDWSLARDRSEDNARSVRYVSSDMTGYEDLDRYGAWRDDTEYGPLWTPMVSNDWVPYRDGSWTWLDPWGWTWVDNAPWGYAPFHYGRWVFVNSRWSWAPGRHHEHPVWAPALVGWVGGSGWNVTFRDRGTRPASGWYPLTPHDRFVPRYHASENHLRWMNDNVRPDPHRPRDFRPQGLTVVPQDHFNRPGRVSVPRAPLATMPALGRNAPVLAQAAPPPPNRPQREWPQHDGVQYNGRVVRTQDRVQDSRDRDLEHGFIRRSGPVLTAPPISGQPAQPLGVNSPTPHLPPQALGINSPTPHQPPQALGINSPAPHQMAQPPISTEQNPQGVSGWQRGERREQFEERRNRRPIETEQMNPPAPSQPGSQGGFEGRQERGRRGEWERPPAPMPAAIAPAPQAQPQMPPQMEPQRAQQAFEARPERGARRGGWERPQEAAPAPAPAAMMAAPRPMPAPVMAAPAPAPAPAPARPAPAPAAPRNGGDHPHNETHDRRQQDR